VTRRSRADEPVQVGYVLEGFVCLGTTLSNYNEDSVLLVLVVSLVITSFVFEGEDTK
jgi:hypothetical protein